MEDSGMRNWPVLKKMLIDNRLEHAAMLAYGTGVSEAMFTVRARAAYGRIESRATEMAQVRADAMAEFITRAAAEDAADADIKARAEAMTKEKEKAEPPAAGQNPDPPPSDEKPDEGK